MVQLGMFYFDSPGFNKKLNFSMPTYWWDYVSIILKYATYVVKYLMYKT